MDSYGIGNGVKGALSVYFRSSRRTGRTSQLVDNVKNGDRIVFKDPREADRVRRLCLDKGVSIKALVINPARPEDLFDKTRGDASSRLLFDHSWVEDFYLLAIEACEKRIDRFQKELSRKAEREPVQKPNWTDWPNKNYTYEG